jgi:hypothetical protein
LASDTVFREVNCAPDQVTPVTMPSLMHTHGKPVKLDQLLGRGNGAEATRT